VQEKWIPRIRYYMGDRMPIVLVATQTDLRDNQIVNCQLSNGGLKSVSRAQGHALAKRIGCASYIECSPNMQKKVKQIINKAISSVLIPQGDRLEMQSCTIL
jgi:GTPase SAR1 family protein